MIPKIVPTPSRNLEYTEPMKKIAPPKANAKTAPGKSLTVNIFWNTLGSLAYQGCLWLTTILVVVFSSDYRSSGMLALAMTIGNMFSPIATYNIRIFQISDTAGKYSQSEYVGFRIQTLLLGIALLLPYTFFVGADADTILVILLFLLFKIDESFCDVLYGVNQRYERMDFTGKSQLLRGILLLVAFCLALIVVGSLQIACAAMFLVCIAVTFLYDVRKTSSLDSIVPKFDRLLTAQMLKECAPLVVGALCMSSVVSIARQYYGGSFGVENLGIYAAVATPAVIVQALARFLYAPVLTPLANLLAENISSFIRFLAKTLFLILLLSVAAVALLSVIGPPLLVALYGNDIADYTYLFTPVLISTVFIVVAGFLNDVLTILRKLWAFAFSMLIALVSCALLMIPLEGIFGMNGINLVVICAMGISTAFSAAIIIGKICKIRRSASN